MENDTQALESVTAQRTELQRRSAQLEGALLRLEEAATERAQVCVGVGVPHVCCCPRKCLCLKAVAHEM